MPKIGGRGDTGEEDRCRRWFRRLREEVQATEAIGPFGPKRCGGPREEDRNRRWFRRLREEVQATEGVGPFSPKKIAAAPGRRRSAAAFAMSPGRRWGPAETHMP
jgi:hypothetical protein